MADEIVLLRELEAKGEEAYDAMYEARDPRGAQSCYAGAKELFYDAIALARRLGLAEDCARLEKRLTHIKAVFRSQFT